MKRRYWRGYHIHSYSLGCCGRDCRILEVSLQLVAVWNGSQKDCDMTTEQFFIRGEEWRVNWQSTLSSEDSPQHFHLIIYDAYNGNIAKELSPTSPYGESYFNGKGRFYVKIFIIGDLGDWRVGAEEYR